MNTRTRSAPRFGVEEEYLLLDERTGEPRNVVDRIVAAAPELAAEHEFFACQLETATPVCTAATEAEDSLRRFRLGAARAAGDLGVVVSGTGLPPIGGDVPGSVTRKPRYRAIAADLGHMVARYYSTGTHVHVEVPSRDAGVEVMARMARWAPALVALTANSPIALGEETGFASLRYLTTLQWPTAGFPPHFSDGAGYGRMVDALVAQGILRDAALVNWSVRLSERFPTVEVRMADAQLSAREAVDYAVLVRALAARGLAEVERGDRRAAPDLELVKGATWAAARHGLGGELVDPLTGETAPATVHLAALIEHVQDELAAGDDFDRAEACLARWRSEGGPADRQRSRFASGGLSGLVELYRQSTAEDA